MSDYKLLIGGRLVDGDQTMDVINPATEEVLAKCPRASEGQLNEAVAAAKKAFPGWAATPIGERRKKLIEIADAVKAHGEELGRLLTSEQGKPLEQAMGEIMGTEGFFRYFASLDLPVNVIEDSDQRRVEEHKKPLGVVGAIIPWNFPLMIVAFKAPAALLAGNTMVIKPSPTTPLTALRFCEIIKDILPAGVINIVTDQNDLGALLSRHPDVAKVSFTGSTETGKKVMVSAAETLKRLTLELGGNDASIVLDDVDPKKVAPGIFQGAFANAGQVCLAIKRVYADEKIYDSLCDELGELARNAVVDDGLKQGSQIGPLQNKMQYEKVKGFLEDARRHGKIVAGGDVIDRPGYFVQPTIVRDISDGTKIVDEEQFGPVLPVIKVRDEADAISRANASPWGLGGSVWSSNPERAHKVAMQMETGTVWINTHLDVGPHIPFGGAKQSGIGTEFGQAGLEEFTQLSIININKG
ncbi:MAG: aldehyde dehydrogenase family protein [Sphingomonadales bacterium]